RTCGTPRAAQPGRSRSWTHNRPPRPSSRRVPRRSIDTSIQVLLLRKAFRRKCPSIFGPRLTEITPRVYSPDQPRTVALSAGVDVCSSHVLAISGEIQLLDSPRLLDENRRLGAKLDRIPAHATCPGTWAIDHACVTNRLRFMADDFQPHRNTHDR